MIVLDGSVGEGGGQILRTSLSLALITGTPFRIERIRAKRAKPGLLRQHLTAVMAATEISSAQVEGAKLGSKELTFTPGPVRAGSYRFAVGSAGSAMLVLQTVLPALLRADAPSDLELEGGTHNPMAPSFEFLQRAFLPIVRRMGATVTTTLERMGFYPAGGGRARVHVEPTAQLTPIEILDRGAVQSLFGQASVAALPRHVAEREMKVLEQELGTKHGSMQRAVQVLDERVGPANMLTVEVQSENVTELFTAYGQKGVRAEDVASHLAKDVKRYLNAEVPAGEYLADQLLLPMALAGKGAFLTIKPSTHTTTQAETIARFLDVKTRFEQVGEDRWKVEVAKGA